MAQTRKGRPPRPSLQPLPLQPHWWRPRSICRCSLPPKPLQSSVWAPQTLRRSRFSLPTSRSPRVSTGAATIPQRRTTTSTTLRRTLSLGQFLSNTSGEHLSGAATEAARPGVHCVSASVARIIGGSGSGHTAGCG